MLIGVKSGKNPPVCPYFWNFIGALILPMALIPLNICVCFSQRLSKDVSEKALKIDIDM